MTRKRSKKLRTPKAAKHIEKKKNNVKSSILEKAKKPKINAYVAFSLVMAFMLVLFLNSYFNYTSGSAFNEEGDTLGTRFYLSGPDPYYNMRTCVETIKQGSYAYAPSQGENGDPLLNYPISEKGARPPLFNMIAIASARIVDGITNMGIWEALGWCMLFLPALYGALLVFPVYLLGKEIFNKKVGLIAAIMIPLIPVHIASGHGSAFSLFDHDSFILLFATTAFFFVYKSYKEKDAKRSILFAMLAGIFVGATELTWVAAYFIFILIAMVGVILLFADIVFKRTDLKNPTTTLVLLGVAFLVQLPYAAYKGTAFTNFAFYTLIIAIGVLIISLIIKKTKMPWIITLPSMSGLSIFGLGIIYLVGKGAIVLPNFLQGRTQKLAEIAFGAGIYGQKVSLTIGEANTFGISQTVMSFGPALYWIAWGGILLFLIKTYKNKFKSEHIFIIVLFIVYNWLLSTAGRFINDLIPLMTIFAAFIIWKLIDKIDYKQMIRNIKQVGGFRGIKKGVKLSHIFGIIFVAFLVVTPGAFLSLDAAVPTYPITAKYELFGEDHKPAWGNNLYKSIYWSEACRWLADQDNEIEDPSERPAFISWWDYGFYESSMGEHPTVADNYQSGIPPAANFQTAESEIEAVSVLIIRLAEGAKIKNDDVLPRDVQTVFTKYLKEYNETEYEYDEEGNVTREWNVTRYPVEEIIKIIEDPIKYAPSYNTLIAEEWGNTIYRITEDNAMYHDATEILTTRLNDDQITNLYRDLQDATGWSIRYYGVEGYDVYSIFPVFTFLADKSVHGRATNEDDYYKSVYVDTLTGKEYSIEEIENLTRAELQGMQLEPRTQRKDKIFNTMVYKTYFGSLVEQLERDQAFPTYGLKHFVPVFRSSQYPYPGTRLPAVIIAKYYEGAKITGSVKVGNMPYSGAVVYVMDDYLGMPHDFGVVQSDGSFELIAPAGEITLDIFLAGKEVGKYITFNTTENPAITEAEATRKIETNRTIDIIIDHAKINGSIDKTGVDITIKNLDYQNMEYSLIVEGNNYEQNDLYPGNYEIKVTDDIGIEIFKSQKFLVSGNNTFNINVTEPKIEKPLNFTTNTTENNVEITWENAEFADLTYIEFNNISFWEMGNGSMIYNGTGESMLHSDLKENETYYYQAWSYNEKYNIYSTDVARDVVILD